MQRRMKLCVCDDFLSVARNGCSTRCIEGAQEELGNTIERYFCHQADKLSVESFAHW